MLRGLYTAASGMIAQQRRHDTVTNNIANLNTPGYKEVSTATRSFPDMLLSAMGGDEITPGPIGKLSTGVFAEEGLSRMEQGVLKQTYRSGDVALMSDLFMNGVTFDGSGKSDDPATGAITYQPQAFFTLQSPDGKNRYTRDGSFQTAADGTLMTSNNQPVLGINGKPIVLQESMDKVSITGDGRLMDSVSGQPLPGNPQLLISRIDDPNQLVREGNGEFRYDGAPAGVRQVAAGERVEVRQGFVEQSNVDAAQSQVDIMSALRLYEANQKVIQFYDRSLDKAVNEIGKV
jgi:flagellar basal-body rod protein FlgF